MQFGIGFCGGLLKLLLQLSIGPYLKRLQACQTVADLRRVGGKQTFDQPRGFGLITSFVSPPVQAEGRSDDQTDSEYCDARPQPVNSGCSIHDRALCCGPVFGFRQPASAEPFPQRRQMAVLRFGGPQGCAFFQLQFGSAFAGFFLFAGEPFAKRRDEVVVGELVEASGEKNRRKVSRLRGRWG